MLLHKFQLGGFRYKYLKLLNLADTEKPSSKMQSAEDSNVKCKEKSIDGKSGKPRNVPLHLWEKFKSLEQRTNETIQRSTEKRIKHLQKQVLQTVTKEFTTPEDRDILREHDVKFGPPVERSRKRKLSQSESSSSSITDLSAEKAEIISLISVDDHLQTTDFSRPPPETSLEKGIAHAIKEGDFSTAEAMSDKLATLEAGEKVAAAFDAKQFLQEKEREKETAKSKKKKKLNWGFEAKQRWETKGNM